jgi:hypothetical protein
MGQGFKLMPHAQSIAVTLRQFGGGNRLRGCTAGHLAPRLVAAIASLSSAKNWSAP